MLTAFCPWTGHCAVVGVDGVFGAGDATSFPVKQGGVATQQADAVAREVAARAGAPSVPRAVSTGPAGHAADGRRCAFHALRRGRWPRRHVGGQRSHTLVARDQGAGEYLSPYLSRRVEPVEPKGPVPADAVPIDVDLSEALPPT